MHGRVQSESLAAIPGIRTLVERDGKSRSFHVANVKAKTLREKIVTTVSRKSHLMTDELNLLQKIGKEFDNHSAVNHSAGEYVRLGGFVHVNPAECRFGLQAHTTSSSSYPYAHAPCSLGAFWDYPFARPNLVSFPCLHHSRRQN
jgi:ISXO2-like transposase domain